MAIASIGAGLIGVTAQTLVDLVDFGLGVKRAQGSPTVRGPDFALPDRPSRVTRGAFRSSLIDAVRGMGIPIIEQAPGEVSGEGFWSGATLSPSGRLVGATSNAVNGCSEGY